ncbi:hypothetical protein GQ44DRAFT_705653 [Phaeosphaeriaceae sp. PMI808]|nr:hypothetical protein GQ44DRAFT_705653 [Phaeosphaeriaceae sp. PMI808]
MPAVSAQGALMELQSREWKNTVGQSGMTPTAFAFLIPVFIVIVLCPFLCVFCVRKRSRSRTLPPARKVKKPALRRAEARERLQLVTEVSDGTRIPNNQVTGTAEAREQVSSAQDTSSISEPECAICLSTLHAPSPPEPVLLPTQPPPSEPEPEPNPTPTPTHPPAPTSSEPILKLHVCGHEFHAECLVSWFVLRKISCPICRALYISKEDMQIYEDEEAAVAAEQLQAMTVEEPVAAGNGNGVRVSNWRYFWAGEAVSARQGGTVSQGRTSRWNQVWGRRV